MYSFKMSVWIVPSQTLRPNPLTLRRDHIKRQHHRRRRIDRHRRRHPTHIDPRKQRLHIVKRVQRHPLTPNLTLAAHMIRVMAHQRRHIKRRRQTRLPMRKQIPKPLVGLLRRPKPSELTHRPQPRPIHRPIHTTRKRKLPRKPNPPQTTQHPRAHTTAQPAHHSDVLKTTHHAAADTEKRSRNQRSASVIHWCGRHSDSRNVAYLCRHCQRPALRRRSRGLAHGRRFA